MKNLKRNGGQAVEVSQALVTAVIQRVAAAQKEPAGGHVVEDEELLACWEGGLLSDERRRELLEHLAACPRCRKELIRLMRLGVVEAGDWAARPLRAVGARGWRYAALVVVAASILIGVGMWWWVGPMGDGQRLLARVQQEMALGEVEAAWEGVQRLAREGEGWQETAEVKALIEEVGYEVARARLAAGDFGGVLEISEWMGRQGGASGRLWNLRLQAERGMREETGIRQQGHLLAYGYEANGESFVLALPTVDETTERLAREYAEAVSRFPEEVGLWLNGGDFLLRAKRLEEARRCFAEVVKREPANGWGWIGLGLATFPEGKLEEAREAFERALMLEPENVAARLNWAIAIYRLGQRDEALRQFREVLRRTADERLRRRIEAAIPQLRGKE